VRQGHAEYLYHCRDLKVFSPAFMPMQHHGRESHMQPGCELSGGAE
jgi:hypothetical protein